MVEKESTVTAEESDRRLDEGVDISVFLDTKKAYRLNPGLRRANPDLPNWLINISELEELGASQIILPVLDRPVTFPRLKNGLRSCLFANSFLILPT